MSDFNNTWSDFVWLLDSVWSNSISRRGQSDQLPLARHAFLTWFNSARGFPTSNVTGRAFCFRESGAFQVVYSIHSRPARFISPVEPSSTPGSKSFLNKKNRVGITEKRRYNFLICNVICGFNLPRGFFWHETFLYSCGKTSLQKAMQGMFLILFRLLLSTTTA